MTITRKQLRDLLTALGIETPGVDWTSIPNYLELEGEPIYQMKVKIISIASYQNNMIALLEDGRLFEYGFFSVEQGTPEWRPIEPSLNVPNDTH